MHFNKGNKILCAILCTGLILQSTVFAAASSAYTSRVKDVTSQKFDLADGVTYTQSVLNDNGSFQHTYKFEYDPKSSSNLIFSGGDSLYSRKLIGTLISGTDPTEGNVVGAVNADFFNMSTGVPESAFIKDGILYTSDRDNYCFAINSDGKAFFDMPSVKLSMTRGEKDYHIVLLNKELTDYGIYMYTDAFSSTTKISSPSTELVLYPYSDVKTYDELAVLKYGNDVPGDLYIEKIQTPASDIQPQTEDKSELQDDTDSENPMEEFTEEITKEKTEETTEQQPQENTEKTSEEPTEKIAEEITEPVYVFNDEYKKELEEFGSENGYTRYGDLFFIVGTAAPSIGKSQNVVVAEKRQDGNGQSLEIPKGSYVLAAQNSSYGYTLSDFVPGETVSINVDGKSSFYNVTDAIGCGCLIVKDGKAVTNTALSHYASPNPRTAVGIKQDGTIVLFAVDGRQTGFSVGMKLSDLSQEMLKAGCVDAANLDGGGSTTVKAYLPYLDSCQTVNKTSDSSERKISNAILVSNTEEKTGIPAYTYFTRGAQIVLKDSSCALGYSYFTDTAHYPVTPTQVQRNTFSYTVKDGQGSIKDGFYYPEGYVGNTTVYSKSPDGYENEASSIFSTDYVSSIYVTSPKNTVYVGDTIDLAAGAKYYGVETACNDEDFLWSVDPQYGYMLEDGLFVATGAGKDIVVTASYGNTVGSIKVNVKELPFSDISGHWSEKEVITLFEKGVVIGENTEFGRMFFPDRMYSRNEFCVMLSRIMGLCGASDEVLSERPVMEFADRDLIPDWSYAGVLALYNKGLLSDFAHNADGKMTFEGAEKVTRREVISVIGRICKDAPSDFAVNASDVSVEDSDYGYIKNAVYAGIFEGYEDGTLRASNSLTRAEGAAVFVRLSEFLSSLK